MNDVTMERLENLIDLIESDDISQLAHEDRITKEEYIVGFLRRTIENA